MTEMMKRAAWRPQVCQGDGPGEPYHEHSSAEEDRGKSVIEQAPQFVTVHADCPLVTFHSLLPGTPAPRRAERDAGGNLPLRAIRRCEPATAAAAFGWIVFPPMDFTVVFANGRIFWTWGGRTDWLPLDAAQFPGFGALFDAVAPSDIRGYSPPFLTALPEAGLLHIWTGLFARSAPEWSLLFRPPANVPQAVGCQTFEAIVEADAWFGPIFATVRLMAEGQPVCFSTRRPLLQVQPVPRAAYSAKMLDSMSIIEGTDRFSAEDWEDYATTIVERARDAQLCPARYAVNARRRRRREPEHA